METLETNPELKQMLGEALAEGQVVLHYRPKWFRMPEGRCQFFPGMSRASYYRLKAANKIVTRGAKLPGSKKNVRFINYASVEKWIESDTNGDG